MKVIFYSHNLHPGGAEKQCVLVAAELKRQFGYETVVLLNDGSDIKDEYLDYIKSAKVSVEVLPVNFIKRIARLYTIFRRNQDGVLFNYLTYPDFFGGFAAWAAGLRLIVGGIETDRMFGNKLWAEYVAHKCFSHVTICNSNKAFEFFAEHGFSKKRMVVLPSGIDVSGIIKADVSRQDNVGIVAVGRFVPEKDYITWVRVIARVYAKRQNIPATIVGYGTQETMIREEIARNHLEKVITILPGQTTDVFAELSRNQIYLSTSIQEGTSNTILEGMAHGLPVVATKVGDNEYMIEDGQSGFLCQPKDEESLANAVLRLVVSPTRRLSMGDSATTRISNKYSLEIILKLYRKIIGDL